MHLSNVILVDYHSRPQDSKKHIFLKHELVAFRGIWCWCGSGVVSLKDDE